MRLARTIRHAPAARHSRRRLPGLPPDPPLPGIPGRDLRRYSARRFHRDHGRHVGPGRRGAQPLGLPAGAPGEARPRVAGRRVPLRPPGLARSKCSAASRAATFSITSWWCPKARTCSISPPPSRISASSKPAGSWPRRATRRSSATWTRWLPASKATSFPTPTSSAATLRRRACAVS